MTRTLRHLAYALVPSPRIAGRFGYLWRPVVLLAFPFAVLVVFVAWSGLLYPLRPDSIGAIGHPFTADARFDGSWGGPTLVGAWVVHALCALGMQVICMALIRRMHGRKLVEAV